MLLKSYGFKFVGRMSGVFNRNRLDPMLFVCSCTNRTVHGKGFPSKKLLLFTDVLTSCG